MRHLLDHLEDADSETLAEGVRLGEEVIAVGPVATERRNGWGTNPTGSDFGDDVVRRAITAKYVLEAHHPVENRSYVAQADADGHRLDGDRPVLVHLGADEPPCDGFWSLTVYGPDMFLVDNEIDRWSLGDRTPGLRRDADGGLTITVGGARPDDTSNWLPAPSGRYGMGLRVYEGHPEIVDMRWFPAPIEPT